MHYVRVTTEADLLESLAPPGTTILAGGTDLLVQIHARTAVPVRLVDISRVGSLRAIASFADRITIGAAAPLTEVLAERGVHERLPLLADVLQRLGSVQIRNRATLGGNLANASPASDSAIPLLLYDAELSLVSPDGERDVPISSFFVGPRRTVLRDGEYIRQVAIPIPDAPLRPFFHKVGRRRALTIAIASVGALLQVEDKTLVAARFAAGSVAPIPLRLRALEDCLVGHRLTPRLIEKAQATARESVAPIGDIRAPAEYRRAVTGDLVARALHRAADARSNR